MARRYYISGEVADGDFLSEDMSGSYDNTQLAYIIFYSDEFRTQVTPTGGNISFTLSPDGINFKTVEQGDFSAADTYKPERLQPSAYGLAVKGKVNFQGVTGATHFTACVWRS
jgi:hypothetical protein